MRWGAPNEAAIARLKQGSDYTSAFMKAVPNEAAIARLKQGSDYTSAFMKAVVCQRKKRTIYDDFSGNSEIGLH